MFMKCCLLPPQIVRWRWQKNVRVRKAEIQTVSKKSYNGQNLNGLTGIVCQFDIKLSIGMGSDGDSRLSCI